MNKLELSGKTPKAFVDGTHRTRHPKETLADYQRFMPRMGITRLANITGLDRINLPVVVAIRPNSRSLATSQGKGDALEAAKASALLESIEIWHGERCAAALRYETYDAMRSHGSAVDPLQLALRSDTKFDVRRPIAWIEGYELATGQSTWVPFEAVNVNFVFQAEHTPYFVQSTNGLASGNQFCEAVLHGLCEVIERDAWTLWETLSAPAKKERQIDLSTVKCATLKRTMAVLEEAGLAVAAWDITSDIEIPVYHAVILENPDSPHWRPIVTSAGHGAHLVPEIALSRAVNEAIQSRLTVISGSRDDKFPSDYVVGSSKKEHEIALQIITEPPPTLAVGATTPPVADYFEADLKTILAALTRVGIDSVVVVDLSQAEIGIPVVKVIVPGLEGPPTPFTRPGKRKTQQLKELSQ